MEISFSVLILIALVVGAFGFIAGFKSSTTYFEEKISKGQIIYFDNDAAYRCEAKHD